MPPCGFMCLHWLMSTASSSETFHQDFLEILKHIEEIYPQYYLSDVVFNR